MKKGEKNMNKKKKNGKYSEFKECTQNFMSAVENHLKDKFGKIEPQWQGLLRMLAIQYDLYFRCEECIREEGLLVGDRLGNRVKNPLLKTQTDAQIQCIKLATEFGLSPKSIKNMNVVDSSEENFISDLIS